uniref:Glycoside hydrolase family 25 protein n=1 Tax=Acrobeloides nanus TaxID=290746 RepID=A0A914E9N0_9BILA
MTGWQGNDRISARIGTLTRPGKDQVYFFIFAFLTSLVSSALAGLAIDIGGGQDVTSQQFACLHDQGAQIAITQLYNSSGSLVEKGVTNILNAYTGAFFDGFNVYITPCLANCADKSTSGVAQVEAVINRLNQEFQDVFIWIQIDKSSGWSSNQQTNQQSIMAILNAVNSTNGAVGIIANYNTWTTYFGSSFTSASTIAQYLLWVNWNGKQDLTTGWVPFGGWTVTQSRLEAG